MACMCESPTYMRYDDSCMGHNQTCNHFQILTVLWQSKYTVWHGLTCMFPSTSFFFQWRKSLHTRQSDHSIQCTSKRIELN